MTSAGASWGLFLAGLCAAGCGTARHAEAPLDPRPPAQPEVSTIVTPPIAESRPALPDAIAGVDSSRTILGRSEALRRLEPGVAQSLNILPSWPEQLIGKDLKQRATIGICVRTDGTVEDAMTVKATGDVNFDFALVQAVRSWRYRPLHINAVATPFCHLLELSPAPDPAQRFHLHHPP
jgi:TonB family protein